MAWLPHKPERSKANKRQNRSNNQIGRPEKCEGAKVISGLDSTSVQVIKQPLHEDRQNAQTAEERFQMGMDGRSK